MNIFMLFEKFKNNDDAVKFLEAIRWREGVVCPYCDSKKNMQTSFLRKKIMAMLELQKKFLSNG